jgi:hypothetical protein
MYTLGYNRLLKLSQDLKLQFFSFEHNAYTFILDTSIASIFRQSFSVITMLDIYINIGNKIEILLFTIYTTNWYVYPYH